MKNFLYVVSFALCIGLFASCTEDDGAVYPTPSEFSASLTTTNVEMTGGTLELVVKGGTLGWKIEASEPWFKISKLYGSGDATVIITVEPNPSDLPRSGEVAIHPTFGQEPVTITITQN